MKGRIPRNLAHEIESNIGKGSEIECRIRFKTTGYYQKLLDFMNSKEGWKKNSSYTVDIYKDEKRWTKIGDKYFNTTKSPPSVLVIVDYEDYSLKFTVSKEIYKEVKRIPKKYDFTRVKERTTFSRKNIKIDLTKVTSEEKEDSYETEVEVIDPENFNYKIFMDTIFMITDKFSDPREKINLFFNKSMGSNPDKNKLNWNMIKRPRDLTIDDLTYDGIVDHYAVTIKADGVMKFLIFHTSGIWFVQFTKDYDNNYELICPAPEVTNGSIYQGELIGNNFYPFDCCMKNGKKLNELDYLSRMSNIDIYGKRYGKYNILKLKIYTYENKVDRFFEKMNQVFKEMEDLEHGNDGLVFHPIYSPYLPEGQSVPKKDRILNQYKDVCKWKPVDKQTIDFLVQDGKLLVSNGSVFKGTETYPFDRENYEIQDDLENKVVEFKPVFEKGKYVYYPERIRTDKIFPNSLDVALEGWKLVRDPITEKMLTGKGNRLLQEYKHRTVYSLIKDLEGYVLNIYPSHDSYLIPDGIIKMINLVETRKIGSEKDVYVDSEDKIEYYFPENFKDNDLFVTILDSTDMVDIPLLMENMDQIYQDRGGRGKVELIYFGVDGEKLKRLLSLKDISGYERISKNSYTTKGKKWNFDIGLEKIRISEKYNPLSKVKKSDIILSSRERYKIKLYIIVKGVLSFDIVDYSKIKRLPVDLTKGIRQIGGYKALGDDELIKFKDDLYRMATIDQGKSLAHSVLKLLNSDYRGSNVQKRLEMADKVKNLSLDQFSSLIKHGILLFKNGNSVKYNPGNFKKWIILYQHEDKSYEPLVHKDKDILNMVFSEDSTLIKQQDT